MKLIIVTRLNPYFENSASANRLLSLIEGLLYQKVLIKLFFTGGVLSGNEIINMQNISDDKGITYCYLSSLSNQTLWNRRFNRYLIEPLLKRFLKRKLLSYILRENANLVWTNSELESFELVIALKKRNPNLNTFIEMSEFLDIHHYNLGNVFQKKIADKRQYLFESKGIYAYNGFALMTKTLFNHYSNFKGSLPRLLHLPMTVDLERFSNATNDSISKTLLQPYIAFVGVMDNKKEGVSILIDAFAKVANHFPKLNLYLFGPYNYDTPGHLKQIEKLNLSEKIHYGGEINRNAIPSILLNAKLLVLPRPDSKQAQGGFPTKLGEYLASGKPVCATRVGEIPDYLIDNESVFFAEPGSVDSFADAISRSMNNPNQSIKVGLNGKKVAETYFNKDIQSKLLFDFLKQL